jgi:multisubunit Na+/H+ antiporter MnhE subunit
VAAVVLLPLGYALVFASGYGGNSTGGSEIVWRIGGLMVYAAFLVLLFAALVRVASLVVTAKRRRRPPTPAR